MAVLNSINDPLIVPNQRKKGVYIIPFILITSLFFLWGMAYGLLDVLNKHFQETLNISKTRSTLLQAAYFGAYFLVALPAGNFMTRFGYKKGIVLGLFLYSIGAFIFFPAAELSSFNFFLLGVFVLASGLTCLETAANPYVTVLGPAETSAFRLNLAQCFNGVGSFLGPMIAASFFFGNEAGSGLDSVKKVYIVIGLVVFAMALIFTKTNLPEIQTSTSLDKQNTTNKLIHNPNFIGAVFTQFFYVSAQVGIAALFINYCTESKMGIDNAKASYLLAASLFLFTAGRFAGTVLMKKIPANVLLGWYGLINVLLCLIVILNAEWVSVYSLMGIFFFESIMFPTIFALGLKGLGDQTKKGSSYLIMSIVGGATMPYLMGSIADHSSTAFSYIVPAACFVIVCWYGWKGYR